MFSERYQRLMHWLGNFHDYELKTIKAAIEVNESQKLRLFKKARKYYDSLKNKKVAVLGLTFKPNTDDLQRGSFFGEYPTLT